MTVQPLPPPGWEEHEPAYGDNGQPDDGFTLEPITAAELCATEDDAIPALLGPLVQVAGRTIIVGDTGEGKTTLSFQLVRAILSGDAFLEWAGVGEGRALIVDLEQGRRSVKRGLRDAQLHEREDVDMLLVPDGLALDQNPAHTNELERLIAENGYTVVVLDPFYKAHQADEPNAERPIVDLMRILDRLRTTYRFALILPAHPRKQIAGTNGPRKLTIHDVAGSGAITRGAEIVLGIERVANGVSRLRFLKDRDADLPTGEAYGLLFSKEEGFRRDPKDFEMPERDLEVDILNVGDNEWRTLTEWRKEIRANQGQTHIALMALEESGKMDYEVGPKGRSRTAKCWRIGTYSEGLSNPGVTRVSSPEAGTYSTYSPLRGEKSGVSSQTYSEALSKSDASEWVEEDLPF
jgi:hypothetical protein